MHGPCACPSALATVRLLIWPPPIIRTNARLPSNYGAGNVAAAAAAGIVAVVVVEAAAAAAAAAPM
ncbi:hypothetical protein I7I50_07912 [Histoplasma capsulatum G186AR]|nr:hypothetical protein I7I52_08428 [Histoplasma capsulatum]QSS68478.1 hypothetical protein I7I50_07912 [Histoplasma capsulatum G186AR]